MRHGTGTRAGRRPAAAWIAGLLAIVVAGSLAIAHYSGLGQKLAASSGSAAATADRSQPGAGSALAGPARGGDTPAAGGTGKAGRTGKAGPGAGTADPGAGSSGRGAPGTANPGRGTSSAVPPPPVGGTGGGQGTAPVYFHTLPPGAALPTDAQCAQWVRESPQPENKAANERGNHITGQHVGAHFFAGGDSPQADALLAGRIDGNFTGTTAEILRWAACKWGIDQDVVFAQAAVESWWQQGTLGDWGSDASACPPGHQPGADGKAGQCPQSYGILQNRYPFEPASWPGIGDSTAMNADTAYAIWRSCYDGYETWLNTVPRGQTYAKGDLWGCVGRWFAGRWHTAPAQQYVEKVQQYLSERIWLTKDFQQG
jgi:autotransporter family porin